MDSNRGVVRALGSMKTSASIFRNISDGSWCWLFEKEVEDEKTNRDRSSEDAVVTKPRPAGSAHAVEGVFPIKLKSVAVELAALARFPMRAAMSAAAITPNNPCGRRLLIMIP